MKKEPLGLERRKYIRLDSVFPVQFRVTSPDGKEVLSDWIQGFTHNIGKGGICLDVNNLDPQLCGLIKRQEAAIFLRIRMPLSRPAVNARAKAAWVKDDPESPERHHIGLNYESIDSVCHKRMMRYAWTKKLFLPVVLSIIFILICGLAVNGYLNIKLTKDNQALISQLVNILQETSIAQQKINGINREKEDLQLKIDALQLRMQTAEEEKTGFAAKAREEQVKADQRVKELSSIIEKLGWEKNQFQEQLIALQHRESAVTEDLLRLDEKKAVLQKANLDKMYRWLLIHQNPHTGLTMSFEGDNDLANWAFIYDQSLTLQSYVNFSDFERAKKILDFFQKKAKKREGLFFNAYYADDGSPVEYIVHSGPNIWVGVAIMQYSKKTGDKRYLALAEEIAQAIISLQNQDAEGGIRGGPNIGWYSTEHNLDGYAFFNMLYKITAKPLYLQARDKVLKWLVEHSYDKLDIPIIRGKGDSTIATDTYAWSIAAIGPEKLSALGMSPDKIIEFAEENCAVEVSYARPDGKSVKIKGFDFAPQRHIARGGVVSSEWTAQMVIAFKLMADFYRKKGISSKAVNYEEKADQYLVELCNMIISSPSPSGQGEGCLPYASSDFVDTGHGWNTPKGKSTGSVSGTAYTIFAYYHYNPLELKE
jgi:hypothetical protein